jgi:hypothetical protein
MQRFQSSPAGESEKVCCFAERMNALRCGFAQRFPTLTQTTKITVRAKTQNPKSKTKSLRIPNALDVKHDNSILERSLWHNQKKSTAEKQKHTTGGIPRWSPTLVLVARFSAYVWQSGRDAQFSLTYGRMCLFVLRNVFEMFAVWMQPRAGNRTSEPQSWPFEKRS